MIGKFIMGYGVSLVAVTITVYVCETLPGYLIGRCLTSINLGIAIGYVFSSAIQALTLPSPTSAVFDTTTGWRIGFSMPIVTAGVNILQLQFGMRYESIMHMIAQNEIDHTKLQLVRVYKF